MEKNNDTTVVEMKVQKLDEPDKNQRVFPSSVANMEEYLKGKGMSNEEVKEVIEDSSNNESVEESPEPAMIADEENPLTEQSQQQIRMLLKQASEMIHIMESSWNASKSEFKLTDTHMKSLYKFNEDHREIMPENIPEDEKHKWDHFNGLNSITEEDVIDIFGEGHPIIGIQHDQTIDRIKDVVSDFFNWVSALKEYENINNAYMQLIEFEEEKDINELKVCMEAETDPEKKSMMQKSLDKYYNVKYLDFLAEPMEEKEIDMLVKTYGDKNKIEYRLNRTRDKLKQLRINSKIILELSKFEQRFLPEKYHNVSNMLLLYYMNTVVYANMGDKNDYERTKVVSMTIALDNVIRNVSTEPVRSRILYNITTFLDQFVDKVAETYGNSENKSE